MSDPYRKSTSEAQQHFLKVVKAKKIVNDTLNLQGFDVDALELAFFCGKCGPDLPLVRVSMSILKCVNCGRRLEVSAKTLPPS